MACVLLPVGYVLSTRILSIQYVLLYFCPILTVPGTCSIEKLDEKCTTVVIIVNFSIV